MSTRRSMDFQLRSGLRKSDSTMETPNKKQRLSTAIDKRKTVDETSGSSQTKKDSNTMSERVQNETIDHQPSQCNQMEKDSDTSNEQVENEQSAENNGMEEESITSNEQVQTDNVPSMAVNGTTVTNPSSSSPLPSSSYVFSYFYSNYFSC